MSGSIATTEDLVFDDERSAGEAVAEHRIGHLRFPQRQSGSGIQRNQCSVERGEEQAMAEYGGDAAVERVDLGSEKVSSLLIGVGRFKGMRRSLRTSGGRVNARGRESG